MAKVKKFGTFGGVFTPSILTILGVIMYLRFPTIIGQAGLINTIGIIVIAHIISITTSLSVASLSTDKTVKTGGTYFMISRSLGLPIGGTLGFALFVGLSFSVSLYLIGFAESFLTYWNLDTSINSVRITGTIILIAVTTVTFISTSLAIKSQYFIMAAIGLSLLSIFFGHHEFAPKEIHLKPLTDAAPFMLLFGIFFPAVTGFEAGVSMSGDLKDAKKSLPVGAMAAVGVGFVVYLGLAFFYAFTVDAEALMNDSQILFKIALVPALVIIGIWGATLSSALGSILGAPRILQAIAMDKIAPKIFAKGTGKTQEPRNALLLAFVIAEAGILIGELDVIARIVSMFFITTYAFLNLACAIESWSSSDFRPAFKIPRFVSILGAVSAFIVMILLDFLALAGAVVVLGLLLFFLRRKELTLESGDAWSSFWTNLAKRSLLKLSNEKTDTRNWRPNIILFRGRKQERLHLVELGLAMSGKLGALTDFELIFEADQKYKPIDNQKKIKNDVQYFSRHIICDSIEDGIKSVTSIYGFSGFEPNTVMMGWSRDTNNTGLLTTILEDLNRKNLNAVFLDYDKQNGFGKKENIDIWWNGKGRILSFSLNLMRFILADPEWLDANVRIMIINSDNQITDKLYRNTNALLQEKRVTAEVKIISDDFGTRSKEMIINNESAEADLIVLGISPNPKSYTEQYIEEFNRISELPSSMLILSPSNEFEEIDLIGSVKKVSPVKVKEKAAYELAPLPAIESKLFKNRIEKLDEDMISFTENFIGNGIKEAVILQNNLVNNFKEFFEFNIKNTEKLLESQQGSQLTKSINKNHQIFLDFSSSFFDLKCKKAISEVKDVLDNSIATLKTKVGNYIFESPETITIPLISEKEKKEKDISIPYRKMISYSINHKLFPGIMNHLIIYENNTNKLFSELKNITLSINDIYEKRKINKLDFKTDLQLEKQKILHDFEKLMDMLANQATDCNQDLLSTVRNEVIQICNDSSAPDYKKKIKNKLKIKIDPEIENIDSFPENWEANTNILNNAALLDCRVLYEQKIIYGIIQNFTDKVNATVLENVLTPADKIIKNTENWLTEESKEIKNIKFVENFEARLSFQETYMKISELIERLPEEIEISNFSYAEDETKNLAENSVLVKINPYKIARYYFDTRLYDPLYREMEQLDKLLKQSIIEFREVNSLLKFRLENAQREQGNASFSDKDFSDFLNSVIRQVTEEKNKLTEAIERV
ncbi:MAG TPA: amino acid permease, partial [Draconibacterium sp.]|nr:amino acid permease [Draconibacterium sp.]